MNAVVSMVHSLVFCRLFLAVFDVAVAANNLATPLRARSLRELMEFENSTISSDILNNTIVTTVVGQNIYLLCYHRN